MSALNRKIDEFCARHPRFGIPNLMRYIILGSALYYMFQYFQPLAVLGLEFIPQLVLQGQIWRIFTFVFTISRNNFFFLLIAFSFAYFVGNALERHWGTARFNIFYLGSMLITVLVGLLTALFNIPYLFIVSGDFLYYAMIIAFAMIYPDVEVYFFMVIPLKMKYVALIDLVYIAFCIYEYLTIPTNIAGALALLSPMIAIPIFFWPDFQRFFKRKKHQASRQTISFKAAQREAKSKKGYLHKCSVCGKTDTDYPDMEFRYCSKCNGYHCYCTDHLNSHVHVE